MGGEKGLLARSESLGFDSFGEADLHDIMIL